jgi:tetratricopeptide (TPR) repeat protein
LITVNKNKNWYSARTLHSSLLEEYPARIVALWRLSMMEEDLQKTVSLIEDIARTTEPCAYGYPALYVRTSFLWHSRLPELYVMLKKPEPVIREAYYAWHNADPVNAYPLWRLGTYYETSGLLSKAQEEYEKAMKVYDRDYRFWRSLAGVYQKQGNLDKAEEVNREIKRRWPWLKHPSPYPSPPRKL